MMIVYECILFFLSSVCQAYDRSYDDMGNQMSGNRVNFTKNTIESLPLPEKGYAQYRDEKVPGLIMRVHFTGVKTFYLYRRAGGKPEYLSIGRFPAITSEQARRQAAELNSEIGRGRSPAEEKRRMRAKMTLSELFDKYLELHAKPYHTLLHS